MEPVPRSNPYRTPATVGAATVDDWAESLRRLGAQADFRRRNPREVRRAAQVRRALRPAIGQATPEWIDTEQTTQLADARPLENVLLSNWGIGATYGLGIFFTLLTVMFVGEGKAMWFTAGVALAVTIWGVCFTFLALKWRGDADLNERIHAARAAERLRESSGR